MSIEVCPICDIAGCRHVNMGGVPDRIFVSRSRSVHTRGDLDVREYNFTGAKTFVSSDREAKLVEALRKIASCKSHHPGDVVDIAQATLREMGYGG